MKITDRMAGDHNTFRRLMAEVDAIKNETSLENEQRRLNRLVDLLGDHLSIHTWSEETFYFPAIRKAVKEYPHASSLTLQFIEVLEKDHNVTSDLMSKLETETKTSPIASTWTNTYLRLCKNLIAHMKKEEEELFPLSEHLLGQDRLEKLSFELEKNRLHAPKAKIHLRP